MFFSYVETVKNAKLHRFGYNSKLLTEKVFDLPATSGTI